MSHSRKSNPQHRYIVALLLISLIGSAHAVDAQKNMNDNKQSLLPIAKTYSSKQLPALQWTACDTISDPQYQCAKVTVPLDYDHLDKGTTWITVIKYIQQGADPKKWLVVGYGGPWGAGTYSLPNYIPMLSPRILNEYSIISFDPRGVGESQILACNITSLNDEIANNDFSTEEGIIRGLALNEKKTQLCIPEFHGFEKDIGTRNTVQDIEHIRELIGTDSLNFMMYSYSAIIPPLYAMSYPETLGQVVMDGAMLPKRNFADASMEDGEAFENTLYEFFKLCDEDSNCPLYGTSKTAYITLLQKLQSGATIPSNAADNMPLTLAKFFVAVKAALPYTGIQPKPLVAPNLWANYLAPGIAQALNNNDATLLVQLFQINTGYRNGTYYGDNSLYQAVICRDFSQPNDATIMQMSAIARTKWPLIGGYVAGNFLTMCKGWQSDPLPPIYFNPDEKLTHGMILSGIWDPETPPTWTKELYQLYPWHNMTVIYSLQPGHTNFLMSAGKCIESVVYDYFLQNKLPTDDFICPREYNPTANSSRNISQASAEFLRSNKSNKFKLGQGET
jgi:pimeloyl-ACP methyl ester carboxylesterase